MTRTRLIVHGAVGTTLLIVALLFAVRRAPETHPWGDTAATSIYALRAANHDLAVGSYSRFQWNHPGPLLYQALAPLYALSGHREISIKWTAWLINMAALTALLVVAWQRAPVLAVTIALALLPLLYREQRLLFWAWNPILPLLPLGLAIVLAGGVASGRLALLPGLMLVLSFLVQSHVAFAPVSAAMIAVASGWLWWRRPSIEVLRPWRYVAIAAIVLAVVWAVPVVHEFRSSPGNLSAILTFFLNTPHDSRSWSTVLTVFANQLVGPLAPSWELTTVEASSAVSWPVFVIAFLQFPLLVWSAVRAVRPGSSFEAALATLCLAVSVTGIFAVRSIVGPVSDYLVTWIAVIGALNLAVIAGEAIQSSGRVMKDAVGPARLALVGYLIVVGVTGVVRLAGKHAYDARSTVIQTLTERLESYCRENGIDRPLLRFSPAGWEGGAGILLQYYKHEQPIAVPDDLRYLVGEPFAATGRESGEFYLMLGTETEIPRGVTKHVWLITHGSFRLIRLFR